MTSGPFAFLRTTSFRLALIYALLFAVFSAGLMGYLFQATVGSLRTEAKSQLEAELRALAVAYNTGGQTRLETALRERSLVRVRNFTYQFETGAGRKIVGDMAEMPVTPPADPGDVDAVTFEIEGRRPTGEISIIPIEGRIVRLSNQSVLLVGIEMSDRLSVVGKINQAIIIAAPIGMLLALIGGFFTSRYAARRAEALSETSVAVMAGDLSQRVPVIGSNDEFDRLASTVNAMLTKIETLMSATRHAGDAIAHDLRSPLSRLRNRLEESLRGPMDEMTARDTLGETVEEVDQVLATFNAILNLSRVRSTGEEHLQKLNISELCADVADLFEPACEEAGLSFNAMIKPDLHAKADQALLAQALSNLIDNAIKYTPRGGAIALDVDAASSDILIAVSDTGPGIPENDRRRVKDRFVRLDDARTQAGSGLGLALVEAVANLHGGQLDLGESALEGSGLKASLTLKRA
ncbi:MAG: HAMP domain-containing sensor histidine kinase [Pseudomonadota bacterium]